jgi:hypothetical protein
LGRVVLDVQRFERAANGVLDLGRCVFIIALGHSAWLSPWQRQVKYVYAAHEGREIRASGIYAVEKMLPQKALTIAVERFIRRGGARRLHAIFMNQLSIILG